MASVTIYPYNILEGGTVTVTGTADTGFPESRLYDRCGHFYWKDTVTEAKVIEVDQGATGNLAVDFMAILGHNFDGEDMQWQYSTTGAWAGEEVDAVTDWTQSGNAQIIKTLTAQTKRYWRTTITSMANPRCAEVFMSKGYTFDAQRTPAPNYGKQPNVQWNRSDGNVERSTKFGDAFKEWEYTFFLETADISDFEEALSYLDELSKPFYFKDTKGSYYLARFTEYPRQVADNKGGSHIRAIIKEML